MAYFFMDLISNKRQRLNSLEKRKKSLKKMAHELSTLCGVEIGMVIVYNGDSEVWPNLETVHKLLPHQDEISRPRTYGVLDYLREKREEVEGKMKKMRESKYTKWDDKFESFSQDQLRELDGFLKAKIGAVREKINGRVFAAKIEQQEQQIPSMKNPESGFYMPEIVQQSNNPYLNTMFGMNPYLEESGIHQQQMPENNRRNQNQMVMNSHGASFNQSNFNESRDKYGHLLKENWFQNSGRQREMMMMENFGVNESEPLMPGDVPNEQVRMLQNWQGQISNGGFPQGH